jgi:hypothetical protein
VRILRDVLKLTDCAAEVKTLLYVVLGMRVRSCLDMINDGQGATPANSPRSKEIQWSILDITGRKCKCRQDRGGSKADLRFIAGTSVEAACNVGSKRTQCVSMLVVKAGQDDV